MIAKLSSFLGTIAAVALVIAALWSWGLARQWSSAADNPDAALWAIRSASIAGFAAAQVLGMSCVVGWFYRRDTASEVMRLLAGLVCTAALVGALTLGWISR